MNSDEVISELDEKVAKSLEKIGQRCEGYAVANLTQFPRVDTGMLRNSITHQVDGNDVYIGTNVPYAIYVEMGTGIYAADGTGRKTPWVYKDSKGEWHITKGMRPSHFLKNAVQQHIDEYKQIIEDTLKE